jgi:hypothetical protein
MSNIQINSENSKVGELVLIDYIPVSGVPLRADNYHVIYKLIVGNEELSGAYFNDFLLNGEHLFICEAHLEIDNDGFGTLLKTTLDKINVENSAIEIISELKRGYVSPKSIENGKVIYTKRVKGSSATHEFEREL